ELASILDEAEIWPVRTNAGFLFNAILQRDFGTGRIDTGFIENHLAELVPDSEPDESLWRAAAVLALAIVGDDEPNVELRGFRINAAPRNAVALGRGGKFRIVSTDDGAFAAASGFRDEKRAVIFYEGQAYEFELAARGTGASHGTHDGEIE